jgi:hypothetical protein
MTLIKKQMCSCGAGRDAEMKFEDAEGGMYFACGDKDCQDQFRKEIEELTFQQTHQGRKRHSYESSMDAVMYCIYVGGVIAVGYLIYWAIIK